MTNPAYIVVHLAGRAGGTSGRGFARAGRSRGIAYHLMDPSQWAGDGGFGRALCGARPGRRSAGWFESGAGTAATCAKCNARAIADATAAP